MAIGRHAESLEATLIASGPEPVVSAGVHGDMTAVELFRTGVFQARRYLAERQEAEQAEGSPRVAPFAGRATVPEPEVPIEALRFV